MKSMNVLIRAAVAAAVFSPVWCRAESVPVPSGSTVKISDHTLTTDFALSGGTLVFDIASGNSEYTGTVTGEGVIEKTGSGNLTFNGGRALTDAATFKASDGVLRFKDFAEAGGAKLYGNNGYFGNAPGYAITIPATTDVRAVANGLNFYVAGIGTNVTLEACNHMGGRLRINGDSFASVIKFAGSVTSQGSVDYVEQYGGTVMLANQANGLLFAWISGSGGATGGTAFGSATGLPTPMVSIKNGLVDAGGYAATVGFLKNAAACTSPEMLLLTNSAPADASLTMKKPPDEADLTAMYWAKDGNDGRLTVGYNYDGSTYNYDLANALYDNRGLTVSKGKVRSSKRSDAFNRNDWFTSPGVSGRYLRLTITKNLDGSAVQGMLAVSEFRLTRAGRPVAWPTGTTATSENTSGEETGAMSMIDGDQQTYWQPGDFLANSKAAVAVIDMQQEVAFNGCQISAGVAQGFSPRFWSLEVGRMVNGQIAWDEAASVYDGKPFTVVGNLGSVDSYYMLAYWSVNHFEGNAIFPVEPAAGVRSYQGPQFRTTDFALSVNAPGSLTLSDHLEEVRTLSGDGTIGLNGSTLVADAAADFTGTINAGTAGRFGGDSTLNGALVVGDAQVPSVGATDAVGDDVLLNLGATGRLSLVHASETVGGLTGSGTVDLGGDGVLTLGGDLVSAFTGSFANGGTLVLAAGTYAGEATVAGDCVVRGAGGTWKGTLAVSGQLTLEGQLKFSAEGLDEGRHVLATFGSLGAGSAAAVSAAVIDPKPEKPLFAEVSVEGNALVMNVVRRGLSVIVR